MRMESNYNPEKDLTEVDQFGFIDITKAVQNGYVPGTQGSVQLEFDDCDDPSKIMGKPSDIFDAFRLQDSMMAKLKERGRYNKDEGSSYNKDEN